MHPMTVERECSSMARSTIEFNDAADDQLEYLTTTLGVKSKAEVVRNALSLYSYLVELLQQPNRVLGIVDQDQGNTIEKVILVPGLNPLRSRKAENIPVGATV